MFSFFHRTPKVHVDCFTCDAYLYESVPNVLSHKTYPQWWLDLPLKKKMFDIDTLEKNGHPLDLSKGTIEEYHNMKNCYGFLEFYKKGFVLESWADLLVKTDEEGFSHIYSNGQCPDSHPIGQRGKGFRNYHHMKLLNPWIYKEKSGVKFLLAPAVWNHEEYDFVIPTGVVDFKSTVSTLNINMFLRKRKQEIFVPVGMPLVHMIPLTEKKLTIKNHLVTKAEHEKLHRYIGGKSFFGWRTVVDLDSRNKKREAIKCPYHGDI